MDRDELAARLDAQERAREIVARAAVPAPAHLRARIQELSSPPSASPRRGLRRRSAFAGGLAAAAIAVAVLMVLFLPGGAGGPSLAEAAGLSRLPATAAAPAAHPGVPALLAADVDGVAFPDWAAEFGWEATGVRSDVIGGRRAVTVFYAKETRRLAYTIVSGDGLAVPGEPAATIDEVEFRFVQTDAGEILTWEREGRTCVISAPGTPRATTLDLAAWRGAGAVGF